MHFCLSAAPATKCGEFVNGIAGLASEVAQTEGYIYCIPFSRGQYGMGTKEEGGERLHSEIYVCWILKITHTLLGEWDIELAICMNFT